MAGTQAVTKECSVQKTICITLYFRNSLRETLLQLPRQIEGYIEEQKKENPAFDASEVNFKLHLGFLHPNDWFELWKFGGIAGRKRPTVSESYYDFVAEWDETVRILMPNNLWLKEAAIERKRFEQSVVSHWSMKEVSTSRGRGEDFITMKAFKNGDIGPYLYQRLGKPPSDAPSDPYMLRLEDYVLKPILSFRSLRKVAFRDNSVAFRLEVADFIDERYLLGSLEVAGALSTQEMKASFAKLQQELPGSNFQLASPVRSKVMALIHRRYSQTHKAVRTLDIVGEEKNEFMFTPAPFSAFLSEKNSSLEKHLQASCESKEK